MKNDHKRKRMNSYNDTTSINGPIGITSISKYTGWS